MALSKPEYIVKKYDVKSGTICLRADGIITFEPDASIKKITMELFYENLNVYKELTKDGKKPFLTDNRIKTDYTAEQKRFMKEQLPKYFTKVAAIIQGGFNKFVFNSFMYIYKPSIPIKIFVNVDLATEWLNEV